MLQPQMLLRCLERGSELNKGNGKRIHMAWCMYAFPGVLADAPGHSCNLAQSMVTFHVLIFQQQRCDCRWYTLTHLDGSLTGLLGFITKAGWRGVWDAWPTPSWAAWAHVAIFGVVEAGLQLLLPGKTHKGPITPKGNVPVYKVTVL